MSISLPWSEVMRRVAKRIEDLHIQLEKAPPDEIRHLQGQIAAFRYVEAMPNHLPHTDQMIGDSDEI